MVKYVNAYDRALVQSGETLDKMGQLVEVQLTQAIQSFAVQDDQMAHAVLTRDDEVDALDESIEREALELISLQQPVDYDLRFLNATMRISGSGL